MICYNKIMCYFKIYKLGIKKENYQNILIATYDLRLTTYDLRLTTYDLRLATCDLPLRNK